MLVFIVFFNSSNSRCIPLPWPTPQRLPLRCRWSRQHPSQRQHPLPPPHQSQGNWQGKGSNLFLWWYMFFSKRKRESLRMQFWSRKKHFRLWNWFLKYTHEFCSYTYIGYFSNFSTMPVPSKQWQLVGKKHQFIIASNDSKIFKLFPCHTNNLSFYMDTMYFMICYITHTKGGGDVTMFFWHLSNEETLVV